MHQPSARPSSDTDTSIFAVTGINDAPTLSKAIPDTSAGIGIAFLFVLDPNTFADVDPGDVLVLSAGTPAWLTFDPASGTFSGTPADADKEMLEVIVTATDGRFVIESDMFELKDVVMEIFNEKGQLIIQPCFCSCEYLLFTRNFVDFFHETEENGKGKWMVL